MYFPNAIYPTNAIQHMNIPQPQRPTIFDDFPQSLFPKGYRLVPGIREVYELQLARYEIARLTPEQLLNQAAYFASVNGQPTRHFLTCIGQPLHLPNHASARLQSFFKKHIFRTGYGTHGLFPYRGKFHPQMVRGLINSMGLSPGSTILDPMMGSGTVPVEATLMGVDSIGIDASPFCVFMTNTKVRALTMSLSRTESATENHENVFAYFSRKYGTPTSGQKSRSGMYAPDLHVTEDEGVYTNLPVGIRSQETSDTYALLFLAFLDAAGYAQRSKTKSPLVLYRSILDRYLFAIRKIQRVYDDHGIHLGSSQIIQGDARSLDINDSSVDGILFSPPYSFAVDYVDNDEFHLRALQVDTLALRDKMVGLRGGPKLSEKYHMYLADMRKVLLECHRVLKPNSQCVIVIGTNTNQLSKALKIAPDAVQGLHEVVRDIALNVGFEYQNQIERLISGISNVMREEYIVFLRKI